MYTIIHFIFLKSFNVQLKLLDYQFILLTLSVLFIAAAGNIINDIFDIEADKINKPKKIIISTFVSIDIAKRWYKFTNVLGISLGVICSFSIDKPSFSLLFFIIAWLLYYYSKKIKGIPLLGNILIAGLISFSLVLIAIFDIDLGIASSTQRFAFFTIILLASFSFSLNLIRELIKDIEDINGDKHQKTKTLPIIIGRKRTKNIAFMLSLITMGSLCYFILVYSNLYRNTMIYLFVFTLIPLLYFSTKLNSATSNKKLKLLSSLLKVIMFLGINSILILTYN